MGLERWKWRPYKVRLLALTKSFLGMGPDVAMLFVLLGAPTPNLPLYAEAEPISNGHCRK